MGKKVAKYKYLQSGKYKVTNWSSYNKSLEKRGTIRLYLPTGNIKSCFVDDNNGYYKGISGRVCLYKPAYISFMLIMYRLNNKGLRQTVGKIKELWDMQGLNISVPSFGHLSDLLSDQLPSVTKIIKKIEESLSKGEDVALALDSSGLRFHKSNCWLENKHGVKLSKRDWRKLHISIDITSNNIVCSIVTDSKSSDIAQMDKLIPDNVSEILADGAYYDKDKVEHYFSKGITPAIPPPKNSIIHGEGNTKVHDHYITIIQNQGKKTWKKKYKYGRRELVEAQFSRIKRCIGDSFLTHKIESQQNEANIIQLILNKWNDIGRCQTVKCN